MPAARASRPASRSSTLDPTMAARCGKAERVRTRDHATVAGSGSGCARRCAASRAACPARAPRDRADTGQTVTPASTSPAVGTAGAGSAGSSACSMMTWALVPEMPNDDTAARRGRPTAGHGRASVTSSTAPADQSMCGDGSSTCRVAGTRPCRMASTILITPATPAAACACPMFDLTEPSSTGPASPRSCPYVASSACASIGSPRVVPVPCASMTSTSAADNRAAVRAWLITRCWAGPFGAVSPLEAPSWLTALARRIASTGWPLRRASDSRSTSSQPTPSEKPAPSAEAANDLHRPSGDRARCRLDPM
ncbi:hypothetical protein B0E53_06331 [Micromonospora sp. MH33]|nr:hypothetical protein B0E53_06331 [Micromonospora sp. MH33]